MIKGDILFRGKSVYSEIDVKTGLEKLSWIYGTVRYLYNGPNSPARTDKAIINSSWGENEVLYDTLNFFSGLFDKNSKKIFENDVVRFYILDDKNLYSPDLSKTPNYFVKEVTSIVYWEHGSFFVKDDEDIIELHKLAYYGCSSSEDDMTIKSRFGDVENQYPNIKFVKDLSLCEVIGNIYDDPQYRISVCKPSFDLCDEAMKEKHDIKMTYDIND